MTSQQIRSLLAPPNVKESRKKALDIIDSEFQTLEDLDGLVAMVEQAKIHDEELRLKLSISQAQINELVMETRSSAEAHLHSAQELSLLRHSLADELSDLSQGLLSSLSDEERKNTLLEDIETLHRNLKELQTVKAYAQIIQRALELSERATEQFHSATIISSASLTYYRSLEEFVTIVSKKTTSQVGSTEERPPQLIKFLEGIREKTWADIRGSLSAALVTAAEKLHWPMPVDYASASSEDRRAFEGKFLDLLKLQSLGEKIRQQDTEPRKGTDGLYALQALVHPITLRFKYHFEGTRQTNRLDKPEWYFTHVLNVAHEHRPFMDRVIQPLMSSTDYRAMDAWGEFTLLLLPLLTRKIKRTVPSLLPHPPLLAHTIYQALAFDAALIEEGFTTSGTSASNSRMTDKQGTAAGDGNDKWGGVSEVILGRKEWFEAWLVGEKKFAENLYHEIISDSAAWVIADDDRDEQLSVDKNLKTTNSARRIKALVEQVTDRYSSLPLFKHRTQFLISVQLPILEFYNGRISSSLDAFETLSSAFVRAVPGALGISFGGKEDGRVNVDTSRLTSGVDGIQKLCKALVSAKFVELAMGTWGEELFFLELWEEINHRASLRASNQASTMLPEPRVPEDTIFQELIVQYGKLVSRSEDMIVHQICGEIESSLKLHFAAMTSPNPHTEQDNDIVLSRVLLAPVALLASHLSFLRSTLPQTTMIALYRRISSQIADHILQREILHRGRGQINQREGQAILAEYELWTETCHAALNGIARTTVEAPWLTFLQAGKLVSAGSEARDKLMSAIFGVKSDDEWENTIVETVGVSELERDVVARVLRTREDCDW